MNKQELQNEINKTKEHLANMEKMLAECEYERWKPETDAMYYFIDSDGEILHACFDWGLPHCQDRYNIYNCFQTREQAEAEAEKILVRRMLEDIAKRLNKGKEIDWNNGMQSKYYLYLNNDGVIDSEDEFDCKTQGTVYCLDSDFYDVAIQEIGEERLKKYLRGE